MPIKIFAAPGDHRDDFDQVEIQFNEWEAEHKPRIISLHVDVETMSHKRDIGQYIMSLVAHYEASGS